MTKKSNKSFRLFCQSCLKGLFVLWWKLLVFSFTMPDFPRKWWACFGWADAELWFYHRCKWHTLHIEPNYHQTDALDSKQMFSELFNVALNRYVCSLFLAWRPDRIVTDEAVCLNCLNSKTDKLLANINRSRFPPTVSTPSLKMIGCITTSLCVF